MIFYVLWIGVHPWLRYGVNFVLTIEHNLPACTVGSLQQHSRMESLIEMIRTLVDAADPHQRLDEIATVAKRLFPLRDSTKHMNGRDLGRLEPTPSLIYRAAACMA